MGHHRADGSPKRPLTRDQAESLVLLLEHQGRGRHLIENCSECGMCHVTGTGRVANRAVTSTGPDRKARRGRRRW